MRTKQPHTCTSAARRAEVLTRAVATILAQLDEDPDDVEVPALTQREWALFERYLAEGRALTRDQIAARFGDGLVEDMWRFFRTSEESR